MPGSLRFPRRPGPANAEPAPETASPPELAQLARGSETTALAQGDPVEVEDVEGRTAASAPHSEHPAPDEGGKSLEGPAWQEEFETPEELYKRFRDVDHVRGRHANEVGQLRRQVGLYERTIRLLARTTNPLERQALVQAAGLIPERRVQPKIERMVEIGEQAHEEEVAYAP